MDTSGGGRRPILGETQGQLDGIGAPTGAVGIPVNCRELDQMTIKGPFQLNSMIINS